MIKILLFLFLLSSINSFAQSKVYTTSRIRNHARTFPPNTGYYLTTKDSKYGLENENGDVILKCKYDFVHGFNNYRDYLIVSLNGKESIFDYKGKKRKTYKYTGLEPINDKYLLAKKSNAMGVIDLDGEVVVPFNYERIFENSSQFSKGEYLNVERNDLIGVINLNNEIVLPVKFNAVVGPDKNGRFLLMENNKWGIIDDDNTVVLPFEYDEFDQYYIFDHSYFDDVKFIKVKKGGKSGMLNKDFNIQIPCQYDDIESIGDSLFKVSENGKTGIVDNNNELLLPIEYHDVLAIHFFREWYNQEDPKYIVYVHDSTVNSKHSSQKMKYGLANYNGIILECIYDEIGSLGNGVAIIKRNEGVGFVNSLGQIVIPVDKYSEFKRQRGFYGLKMHYFYNNIAVAKKNNKWGLVDRYGKELTSFVFDEIGEFRHKKVVVRIANKEGLVDREGNVVLDCVYDAVYLNRNNIEAKKGKKKYYFNKKGKFIREELILEEEDNIIIEEDF